MAGVGGRGVVGEVGEERGEVVVAVWERRNVAIVRGLRHVERFG